MLENILPNEVMNELKEFGLKEKLEKSNQKKDSNGKMIQH